MARIEVRTQRFMEHHGQNCRGGDEAHAHKPCRRYGIDGVFDDPDDEGRGVLEFKQGFNGYVEELPGEFVLPVKPVAYAMKQFAHKLLSR